MKEWLRILGVCWTRCILYSVDAVLGVCCTWGMLHSVYAARNVNSLWWHREIESNGLSLCSCNHDRVVDKTERNRGGGWEWYGGYEQLWEVRSTTCSIVFGRSRIGNVTSRVGTRNCPIGDGQFTRTWNSLKSQFVKMISPISSRLSLSLPSPQNRKFSHPYLSLHAMIMS